MTDVLDQIRASGTVVDRNGATRPLGDSPMQWDCGELLKRLVVERNCVRTLEIGLAYGISAMFICAAHAERGKGRHIAIDPFQKTHYDDIGLLNLDRAGLGDRLTFYEARSDEQLPKLVERDEQVDFALIDGFHTFDQTVVDFFFVDKLLRAGGLLAIDDVWMPSVRKAISFILNNRPYELFRASSPSAWRTKQIRTIAGRFLRSPFGRDLKLKLLPQNTCILRKVDDSLPEWNSHRSF